MKNKKKTCYSCCNYYREGGVGGYLSSNCKVYGSLDCDQKERRPDISAETCEMYNIEFFTKKEPVFIDFKNFEPFINF